MANAAQKIALSASRDIPCNELILSQLNVRRHKTIGNDRPEKSGGSIDELAEDIFRRTLLQNLSLRAIVNAEGEETGMLEVPRERSSRHSNSGGATRSGGREAR